MAAINVEKYTSLFGDYLKWRFSGYNIHLRDINKGFDLNLAKNWAFLGVEYKANFFLNGEKRMNFFIMLEFPKKEGLVEKIKNESKSGKIIHDSKNLSKPLCRAYLDGKTRKMINPFEGGKTIIDVDKYDPEKKKDNLVEYIRRVFELGEKTEKINPNNDYYFICCRIKSIPEKPKDLFNSIWGFLVKGPAHVVTKY